MLHGLFACMDFPARRKSFMGKPMFCKFCMYFPCRMQGTCGSVAGVLYGMHATPGDGAWKLRTWYGQHTCTARYGHLNSVVNARELRARCEGMWTYKNEWFFFWQWQIIRKSKWFSDIAKTFMDLLMSEIIYRYWKLLFDIGNYFPKSSNTG